MCFGYQVQDQRAPCDISSAGQMEGLAPQLATWEDEDRVPQLRPAAATRGQVAFQGRRNVMNKKIAVEEEGATTPSSGRPARVKKPNVRVSGLELPSESQPM